MRKAIKLLLGLLLLPAAFFACFAAAEVVWALLKHYKITVYFLAGFALYTVSHFYLFKFNRVYVLAHEFSHAIAALLCGYKVSSVSVNEDSGKTKVSGANVFVFLAPYIIPLYAILTVVVFYTAALFTDTARYRNIFLLVFGFFSAMHIWHTIKSLTETEQSDISSAGGGIFSFIIIVFMNAAVFLILFEFLFTGVVPVGSITISVANNTLAFWKAFLKYAYQLISWAVTR